MIILKMQIDCAMEEYKEFFGPDAEDEAREVMLKRKKEYAGRDFRAWIAEVEPTKGGWHVIA